MRNVLKLVSQRKLVYVIEKIIIAQKGLYSIIAKKKLILQTITEVLRQQKKSL